MLINGITETIKVWNEKTRRRISSCFFSTFSHFISATSNCFSSKKVLVEEELQEQKEHIKVKILSSASFIKQYRDNILITSLDLMAFFPEIIYLEGKTDHMW